jgi:anti-sigma B factor antagonist
MEAASLKVETQVIEGDVHVFDVAGELDLNTAPRLRDPLERAIEGGARAIMVDLTECEFIDSTGIAVLIWAWQSLKSNGDGKLALCCPDAQVRRLLELTGVIEAISIHGERDAAIASLRP